MKDRVIFNDPISGVARMICLAPEANPVVEAKKVVAAYTNPKNRVLSDEEANAIEFVQANAADLNYDSEYRNAMVVEGDNLAVDLAKAKKLHADKMRELRREKMVELDGLEMRALAENKNKDLDAIRARKQKLRDAPNNPKIASAKKLETLRKIWESELGDNPFEAR